MWPRRGHCVRFARIRGAEHDVLAAVRGVAGVGRARGPGVLRGRGDGAQRGHRHVRVPIDQHPVRHVLRRGRSGVLHPGIYGLVYSTWGKTYDRTGLFCATPYAPPAGQIYVSQVVYQTYLGIVYLCGSAARDNAAGARRPSSRSRRATSEPRPARSTRTRSSEIWWNTRRGTPAGYVTATHNG